MSIFNAPDMWYYVFSAAALIVGIGATLVIGKKRVQKSSYIQWIVALVLLAGIASFVIVFVRPHVDKCQAAGGTLKRDMVWIAECLDTSGNVIPRNDWQ